MNTHIKNGQSQAVDTRKAAGGGRRAAGGFGNISWNAGCQPKAGQLKNRVSWSW